MEDKKTIYKYFVVERDEHKDRLRKLFKENQLYFSGPQQLRDPFELRFIPSFEETTEEKIRKEAEMQHLTVAEASTSFLGKTDNEIRKMEQRRLEYFEKILFSQTSLCCFSKITDNILMWSHYANKHKGICICFSIINEETLKFIGRALPVNYPEDETFPVVNFYKDSGQDMVKKMILTKASDWSYEKELRIINFKHPAGYMSIPRGIITGIILGCCFRQKDIDFIKELIGYYGTSIEIFKANIDKQRYVLEINNFQIDA